MEPLVSIVVPVYNARDYIEDTIHMVERQTFRNFELILVDDCSADDSVSIINRCIRETSLPEGSIRLIAKERNEKTAAARNSGIDAARGRYIAFLDADDVWLADKLEKQLDFMRKGDYAFSFTAYEFGDENARPTGKIVNVPLDFVYKEALYRTIIFTSTVIFDTDKLSKEDIHMPLIESEDTATWWKVMQKGVTAHGLNEVLTIYRRPAASLSSNKLKAVKRIWGLYRQIAGLGLLSSCVHLLGWAYYASKRRL
ncbi:glycosyltransferase family 2 protein [Butyrivibrio sp. MC2013]|uniref:glycosyltransferase family 2 protein n=1 Tax=Butyrivibrio sp. MC2013 TaxID=1280686 RepID=UPI000404547B|nr:glycosyltransferase family 2 protein [Butyrivibrio sp. MC2013]